MKQEELKQKIREEIQCFMEHHDVLTRLEGVDWYYVEDALVELLTGNTSCQRLVANLHDRYCHETDVMDEMGYYDENAEYSMTDIKEITDLYEENLGEDESWHKCLINAYYDFKRRNKNDD